MVKIKRNSKELLLFLLLFTIIYIILNIVLAILKLKSIDFFIVKDLFLINLKDNLILFLFFAFRRVYLILKNK